MTYFIITIAVQGPAVFILKIAVRHRTGPADGPKVRGEFIWNFTPLLTYSTKGADLGYDIPARMLDEIWTKPRAHLLHGTLGQLAFVGIYPTRRLHIFWCMCPDATEQGERTVMDKVGTRIGPPRDQSERNIVIWRVAGWRLLLVSAAG